MGLRSMAVLGWINHMNPDDPPEGHAPWQPRDTFHQGHQECTGKRGPASLRSSEVVPSAGPR